MGNNQTSDLAFLKEECEIRELIKNYTTLSSVTANIVFEYLSWEYALY